MSRTISFHFHGIVARLYPFFVSRRLFYEGSSYSVAIRAKIISAFNPLLPPWFFARARGVRTLKHQARTWKFLAECNARSYAPLDQYRSDGLLTVALRLREILFQIFAFILNAHISVNKMQNAAAY